VVVTDALGCSEIASVNLVDPTQLNATISTIVPVACTGQSSGSLTVTAAGGLAPYTYSWSTVPPQTGATATNLAVGSYNVLVTDANGCFTVVGAQVTQPLFPLTVAIIPPPPRCPGVRFQIFGNATGGTGPYTYNWTPTSGISNPSTANPYVTYDVDIIYTLTVTDINGCVATARDTVFVYDKPQADFLPIYTTTDSVYYNEQKVRVRNLSYPDSLGYAWTFGDETSPDSIFQPIHKYYVEGTYQITLIVISEEGCRDTAVRVITYRNIPDIYVPNAFSPNGDGVNDFFSIATINIRNFTVQIFDRWGNMLYTSKDPFFRWDGAANTLPLPEGVYTYILKGIGSKDELIEASGTVTLIR
jgi:gliding motility-associated-like protein